MKRGESLVIDVTYIGVDVVDCTSLYSDSDGAIPRTAGPVGAMKLRDMERRTLVALSHAIRAELAVREETT